MKSIQNQPADPAKQAPAVIGPVMPLPTLEGLQQWLLACHGYASFMMCTTTGAELARHAQELDQLATTLMTVHQFVRLSRG